MATSLGGPVQARDSEGEGPSAGPLPRRIGVCVILGAKVSLGRVVGCGL